MVLGYARLYEKLQICFSFTTADVIRLHRFYTSDPVDYRKYNQDLTTGSLLIEVGTHGNTLEQVEYSGELLGKSLAKALLKLNQEN